MRQRDFRTQDDLFYSRPPKKKINKIIVIVFVIQVACLVFVMPIVAFQVEKFIGATGF